MNIRKTASGLEYDFSWSELENLLRNMDINDRYASEVDVQLLDEQDNFLGYLTGHAGNTERIAVAWYSQDDGELCHLIDKSPKEIIPVIVGGIIDPDPDPDFLVPVDMAVTAFRTYFLHQQKDSDLEWVCTDW
ncbi:MAG: hypothetical protein AAGK74_15205 [Chloroflexota bacterium]